MIGQVIRVSFVSLGAGFLAQLIQNWLGSQYFTTFLQGNLVNLLVALLAVNSATMGIVLTKIRDLVEKHGHADSFTKTRHQMLLAVREQILLTALSIVVLTLAQSPYLKNIPNVHLLFGACTCGIFVYAMTILYDIARGVLIIIDFKL